MHTGWLEALAKLWGVESYLWLTHQYQNMTSGDPSECTKCSYHPMESNPPQLPLLTGIWAAQHGLVLSPLGNSDACGEGWCILACTVCSSPSARVQTILLQPLRLGWIPVVSEGQISSLSQVPTTFIRKQTGSLKSVNNQAGRMDDLGWGANSNLCLPGIPFTLPL